MDIKIPASVKIEQPEVYVDYPGEGSMESHSLLPSDNIKLEPACEADNVHSSTREIISHVQVLEKMDSQIPTSVKIEQPEVFADCPGEDAKIQPSSQSPSLQEQSQKKEKKMFGNIDWKLVKHELSVILCDDKSNGLSKMVAMSSFCSIQERAGHNKTELRMLEDTALIDHQEVSLVGTENGYTASQQHEHCSQISECVSSVDEINTKLCLTSESCQLHHIETSVKHTQIPGTSLDYTFGYVCCSPQRIPTGETPHMSVCDVNISVDTFVHTHKTTDTGKTLYKCDDCGASFTKAGNLMCHMRTHTGEKPYKCEDCGASFTKATNLKCHMRTHIGEKPYKCDVCAASFTKNNHVKRHMRTHTGEKPYQCDICGTSFTEIGSLNCHMRVHREEKPYKCDICAASFTKSYSLKCHMRTHTGERPYKCDICASSFTTNNNLKRHMNVHRVEKPYKCATCFTQTGHLKHHKRTHIGEKSY